MDSVEAQTRAIIAAALIVRGAVEVPSMPTGGQRVPDAAGVRLRELTDISIGSSQRINQMGGNKRRLLAAVPAPPPIGYTYGSCFFEP